ncbi:MAG: hypothetical protein ACYS7Y_04305 [Planctomycetota bacterium]|jgi:hypothetical protein
MKEKMSNNELFQWKTSPTQLILLGILGSEMGWEGFTVGAIILTVMYGVITLWTMVRES